MGGWGGVYNHFHVQPNYSVEVVLCCRWVCDNNGILDKAHRVHVSKLCNLHETKDSL